jgi:hypothetical protein
VIVINAAPVRRVSTAEHRRTRRRALLTHRVRH